MTGLDHEPHHPEMPEQRREVTPDTRNELIRIAREQLAAEPFAVLTATTGGNRVIALTVAFGETEDAYTLSLHEPETDLTMRTTYIDLSEGMAIVTTDVSPDPTANVEGANLDFIIEMAAEHKPVTGPVRDQEGAALRWLNVYLAGVLKE